MTAELSEIDRRLIGLLAAVDVLFAPIRDWRQREMPAAIVERRGRYATTGVAYGSSGLTNAERIELFKQSEALERSGCVQFFRRNGKRVGWKLTDSEDWRLRALCLLYGERPMVEALRELQAATDAGIVHEEGGVPEIALTGGRGWGDGNGGDLVGLEERLAPALCRGLVVSQSDAHGRAAYAITDQGRQFLDSWQRPAITTGDSGSTDAADEYNEQLILCREELAGAKPSRPGEIAIPISAGCWPRLPRGAADNESE